MSFLISINGTEFEPYNFPADGIHRSLSEKLRGVRATEAPRRVKDLDLAKNFDEALSQAKLTKYREQQRADRSSAKQRRLHRAKDLMSSPVVTVHFEDKCSDALYEMQSHGFHHLVVVDKKNFPVGIISDRDFLRARLEDPQLGRPVAMIMSRNLIVATPDSSLFEVAWALRAHRIHCLPIVAKSKELVGILTTGDILGGLLNRADVELWG